MKSLGFLDPYVNESLYELTTFADHRPWPFNATADTKTVWLKQA